MTIYIYYSFLLSPNYRQQKYISSVGVSKAKTASAMHTKGDSTLIHLLRKFSFLNCFPPNSLVHHPTSAINF